MTQSKRELVQDLLHGVNQDIEDYKKLQALLSKQRQLMLNRDNEGLSQHNPHQTQLCSQLMHKAKLRSQALRTLGFKGDSQGMSNFISRLPQTINERYSLKWQQLLSFAKEGQRLNEANGVMLAEQQQVIKKLLNESNADTSDYSNLVPNF